MRSNSGCRCVREIRRLAAAAVVLIGLGSGGAAQSPAPDEPPPISPLSTTGASGTSDRTELPDDLLPPGRRYATTAPFLGDEDEAFRLLKRARVLASRSDSRESQTFKEAIKAVDRAFELAPYPLYQVEARCIRGRLFAKVKESDAALTDLSWVIERDPDHFAALATRARILADRGEIDRALVDLDRGFSTSPYKVSPALLTLRGWCHAERGVRDRAIDDYSAAILKDPSWLEARWYRAQCYLELDRTEKAREDIEEILRLRPDDLKAHFARLILLLGAENYVDATAEATRLTAIMPDQPGPYLLHFGTLYLAAVGSDRQLARIDRIAARIEPILPCSRAPGLVRALATGMSGMGWRVVMADLDRCLAMEPALTPLYVLRANYHAKSGRYVPLSKDIACAILSFNPREYSARIWVIDWKGPLFGFELSWKWKGGKDHGEKQADAADAYQKCLDMAFQQLLASAFGSSR